MIDTEKLPKEKIYMPQIASEDTATWWTILKGGITAYGLDEVLAIYRRPANSLSSNKIVALKRIWGLYRKIAGLSVASSMFLALCAVTVMVSMHSTHVCRNLILS